MLQQSFVVRAAVEVEELDRVRHSARRGHRVRQQSAAGRRGQRRTTWLSIGARS